MARLTQDEKDVRELFGMSACLEKPEGGIALARLMLRVRDRAGVVRPLVANRAQREFALRRGRQNIVLKARQMGMTTWVAGRFFLKTITSPGVMTVQVAQTREAAEGIFRIVQRFWEHLPEYYKDGPLRLSRSNAGQMVFAELDSEYRVVSACDENAGRGLTMQNLHCSEVARWPGDAGATLAGLRAALAPRGEMVMESTPNGAYGAFYEEWGRATETGVVKHFLPWWWEEQYAADPALDLSAVERDLVERFGLTAEQVGFRRGLR